MRATPDDVNALVVVPVYGFVSDATRLDLLDTAHLAKFHGQTFEDVLAPDSDFHHYLKVFPPNYVLMVSEPLEMDSPFKDEAPHLEAHKILKLFGKSILTAINLLTSLRLYGGGLLLRGDIWILITLADHDPPGQLSLRFSPTGSPDLDWIGAEGSPYWISEQDSYQFTIREIPHFRSFFEQVTACLGNQESSMSKRARLALQYYNRTFGVEQRAMRLIDLVTCLEALLSDRGDELSHRLAMRSANLLGIDPVDRKRLYEDIRGFYGIRSKLVHGAALKESDKSRIREVEKLREYVRRALLTILSLTTDREFNSDIPKTLDEMSLDDDVRKAIQEKGSRLLHLNAQGPKV